ncbi:MAG: ATP-binding cassette domain-containing protein [Bdellovibrionota bacterium]|nr:ATP-binding cassette domain-containing protein [Bdellovibrionota bacterium]
MNLPNLRYRERRKEIKSIELKGFGLTSLNNEEVLKNVFQKFESGCAYRIQGALGDCSELLKALAFIHDQVEGEVLVNSQNALDFSFEEFHPWRMNIAYTFDYGGLLNNRSIKENIALPLQYHDELELSEIDGLVEEYLKLFNIFEFKDLRPAMTPGFVRKLGCIIRSLIVQPEVLIMDGPTASLDKERSETLVNYVSDKFHDGSIKMIFYSTSYEGSFKTWEAESFEISSGNLIGLNTGELAV